MGFENRKYRERTYDVCSRVGCKFPDGIISLTKCGVNLSAFGIRSVVVPDACRSDLKKGSAVCLNAHVRVMTYMPRRVPPCRSNTGATLITEQNRRYQEEQGSCFLRYRQQRINKRSTRCSGQEVILGNETRSNCERNGDRLKQKFKLKVNRRLKQCHLLGHQDERNHCT